MSFNNSLADLNVLGTYSLQVVFAYVATLCVCAFIENPRIRVRMWSCFLLLTIAAWPASWSLERAGMLNHKPTAFGLASVPYTASLHVMLPVKSGWVPRDSQLASAKRTYMVVLLALLLHMLVRSVQLRIMIRRDQRASPRVRLLFRRLCVQLRIRKCDVGLIAGLRSPATCSWLRNHVLLPTNLINHLDADQLADVLRHELIHVRRHDYLWDRLAALGCRLVFFHPLIWFGYRHLRWERELSCDQAVVAECSEGRLRYAECLIALAGMLVGKASPSKAIGFSSSASLLATRVRALLNEPTPFSARDRVTRAGLISVVTLATILWAPSLGVTLYLPEPLTSMPAWSPSPDSIAGSKKSASRRSRRTSRSNMLIAPSPLAIALTPGSRKPIEFLFDSQSPSLPVLQDSVPGKSITEPVFAHSRTTDDDLRTRGSSAAWDESPMPLAKAPSWRKIVTGAIINGVAIVTGRIDNDDVDVLRKHDR